MIVCQFYKPVQFMYPSPEYPKEQEHSKLPSVSLQSALLAHGNSSSSHSFTSDKTMKITVMLVSNVDLCQHYTIYNYGTYAGNKLHSI